MGFFDLPEWLSYLLRGLSIFALMSFLGVVAGKAGRNPYYAVFCLFPPLFVVLLWLFAFTPWPKVDGERKAP